MTTKSTEQQRLSQAILDARHPGEKDRAIDRYEAFMADLRADHRERDRWEQRRDTGTM